MGYKNIIDLILHKSEYVLRCEKTVKFDAKTQVFANFRGQNQIKSDQNLIFLVTWFLVHSYESQLSNLFISIKKLGSCLISFEVLWNFLKKKEK